MFYPTLYYLFNPGWTLPFFVTLFIAVTCIIQHRANIGRILRGEDKMRSGFVFTDSSIHPLPPGAQELTVEGERTVVNVDFPAFAAAVPALPCLAGKSIGKGRPDMKKNFLRHKMHRVLS